MRIQTLVLTTLATLLFSATSLFAEIPEELENIVFGDEKRSTIVLKLNDLSFEALQAFSNFPYLMWPRDVAAAAALPYDKEGSAAWLNGVAKELGYSGFEVSFNRTSSWRGNEVWIFELIRKGLTLHDARIEVHWQDKRMIGIVNHTPGPVRAIEDLAALPKSEEWVYHARRNDDRSYDLVPARVTRQQRATGEEILIKAKDEILTRNFQQSNGLQWIDPTTAVFTEYNVPSGTFPDQISLDENGIVWFSQPSNNAITEFDPITETFLQHPTTGASTPDGMIVGTQGRVWSGMYNGGGLGVWDSIANKFSNYPASYGGPRMAVPVETTDGNVWVTDHLNNRISEFDPITSTWLQSLIVPTPSSWIVQGYEDTDHGQIYFTEYSANQLAKIAVGGSQISEIPTPGGGPAFCVYSNDKVYYSRWNEFGIGAYDVNTQQITEYDFPINGEQGGPMWIAPNGKIVTGTLNSGYIMIFDPSNETFAMFKIPTNFPGLKDGMTVGANGVIWFTESQANKIAKLTLMPLVPKSISER